ncbi:protein kinase C-binding protein NELL1-like [Dreissena polymorpha]|uniref:Uncharacterized protein n=1 Tax=Dreissena polymorpha TaxID=45954 RepID=A0A9D4HPN6_DREPO|nr:protein kinase C-binding protein NELL1-like [Dreissena polymorpha]XP_052244320.1 protein kinase C-binding protein NELL1-like [Dreissena polymorpha]KAH3726401.1 hypothetical protein DPMN_052264 [Dreissena polymorpha]
MGIRTCLCSAHSLVFMLGCIAAGLSFGTSSTVVLDLLESINRTEKGFTVVPGPDASQTALFLQDSTINFDLTSRALRDALMLFRSSNDVTILATVRQEAGDSGSIITFANGQIRYLDVEISGPRDEIRLHYLHSNQGHVATFPYRLGDNHWHSLALTFTDTHVTLRLNCSKLYERVILPLDLKHLADSEARLALGSRDWSDHFRIAISELKIVTNTGGSIDGCRSPPSSLRSCPSCAEFQISQSQSSLLYSQFQVLHTMALLTYEDRISGLEQCRCMEKCGSQVSQQPILFQKDQCTICVCQNGSIECRQTQCPALDCVPSTIEPDECCPTCFKKQKQCYYHGVFYQHGAQMSPRPCHTCVCDDGVMQCDRQDPITSCPKLGCSGDDVIYVQGQCCPICRGTNFCSAGHNCHPNATCINLATRSTCQCRRGFQGNGTVCEDINECLETGGKDGHYCHSDQVCENTMGSYKCKCSTVHSQREDRTCPSSFNGQEALFQITWSRKFTISVILVYFCFVKCWILR